MGTHRPAQSRGQPLDRSHQVPNGIAVVGSCCVLIADPVHGTRHYDKYDGLSEEMCQ